MARPDLGCSEPRPEDPEAANFPAKHVNTSSREGFCKCIQCQSTPKHAWSRHRLSRKRLSRGDAGHRGRHRQSLLPIGCERRENHAVLREFAYIQWVHLFDEDISWAVVEYMKKCAPHREQMWVPRVHLPQPHTVGQEPMSETSLRRRLAAFRL